MRSEQQHISEYLQCEFCHSVGAYRVADGGLGKLVRRLEEDALYEPETGEKIEGERQESELLKLVRSARKYNWSLGYWRHASPPARRELAVETTDDADGPYPVRDPLPEGLPLSECDRFRIDPDDDALQNARQQPWKSTRSWDQVPRFYTEALHALGFDSSGAAPVRETDADRYFAHHFATSLIAPRDGALEIVGDGGPNVRGVRRFERYEHRRAYAHDCLSPKPTEPPADGHPMRTRYKHSPRLLERIATENLGTPQGSLRAGTSTLPIYVIKAQTEAHLCMHAVEAWQSMCLGEHARELDRAQREWLNQELDRCIVLFTFVYSAGRTAPWMFAADDEECKQVFEGFSMAWENMVPARCMLIATQLSLLSLYRRAYARNLKGESGQAYNDYHKLQRLIRNAERRVRAAPIQVEQALEFLAGLDAQAHHHIGELYRAEHAHRPALEHFEAAAYRLAPLRDRPAMKEVLTNSRWHVQLQVSRGKASYELGRHKQALCWHLNAWRAFLELLAGDTRTETNMESIDDAIEWLNRIKLEPDLRKSELGKYIGPVIDQLGRITVSRRLGALAAEILLRLGHLLFVLNIGLEGVESGISRAVAAVAPYEPAELSLAVRCLLKAAECDRHSTLIGADLLKARFRSEEEREGDGSSENEQWMPPELPPIDQHWPRGGNDYEQIARVAEYLILKSRMSRPEERLDPDADEQTRDSFIARDLLLNFFISTDSINVRKSQIHRFLMKDRRESSVLSHGANQAIELVCMRRYSSPFPLLPRPSAFRALGGGYFIRLLLEPDAADAEQRGSGNPKVFGLVVDPGVDFIENLYRTGYSLGDIDMVLVTHDHVDHLGGLDPLLSLLHVRFELLDEQNAGNFAKDGPTIKVLLNKSVYQRYKDVDRLMGVKAVRGKPNGGSAGGEQEGIEGAGATGAEKPPEFEFRCFEDMLEADGTLKMSDPFFDGFSEGFEIVAMSSAAGSTEGKGGHRDLSDCPSYGVCLRSTKAVGPSLAITSDTPRPPRDGSDPGYDEWRKLWTPALVADVLVVHLSSVPLTELRRLDQSRTQTVSDGVEPIIREEEAEGIERDEIRLSKIRRRVEDAVPHLRGQIEYAQWLRSGHTEHKADVIGLVPGEWLPPSDHPYLEGLLAWAREYQRERRGDGERGGKGPGLFVIGELSEELGTMRGKVATRLNQGVFEVPRKRREALDDHAKAMAEQVESSQPVKSGAGERATDAEVEGQDQEEGGEGPVRGAEENKYSYALTADIGLTVCVDEAPESCASSRVSVLCTTCDLDTDRVTDERYHVAHDVSEVCVKGENEGIFYNCREHDPICREDPVFLEQLERFDIFGR